MRLYYRLWIKCGGKPGGEVETLLHENKAIGARSNYPMVVSWARIGKRVLTPKAIALAE